MLDALRLSLVTSLAATAISVALGVPLAWVLARIEFPGRAVVRGLVLLPLVLPPVVGGAALLFALGRRGFVGDPLGRLTGLVLPFSTWGVILAVTFVAMPFLVITVGLGAVQFLIGNVAEPALMGKSLNLSSLMIILSLTFWGMIWGIPGMFLSVPMMVMVAIVCARFDGLRPIAVILSANGEVGASPR